MDAAGWSLPTFFCVRCTRVVRSDLSDSASVEAALFLTDVLLLRGPERSVKAFNVGVANACAASLTAEQASAGE